MAAALVMTHGASGSVAAVAAPLFAALPAWRGAAATVVPGWGWRPARSRGRAALTGTVGGHATLGSLD